MSLLDAAGVVTGDIWCSGAFSFDSPLKDLIDTGEYTLEQLLAEDELLQELRGVHPQLVEFFSTEQAVTGLVKYVTLPHGGTPPAPSAADVDRPSVLASTSMVSESLNDSDEEKDKDAQEEGTKENAMSAESESPENGSKEPQAEGDEQELDAQDEKDAVFVRYPYMACEVICCEIKGIIDALVDGYVPDSETSSEEDKAEETTATAEGKEEATGSENEVAPTDDRRSILDLLFAMLYEAKAGEVDDYRAGYFDKILSVLFRKRPEALALYINEGGGRGQSFLMRVMLKHLYSHSIMQIVQRLLLPQPPLPPKDDDDEDKEGENLFSDPMEGADMDGFGSFRCTWSDSEEALELLLESLIDKSPYPEIEEDEERQLSLYQNASEVLITIIQNSPLTSPTLHRLTTNPVLERLIRAATTVEEGGTFSPHDSRQTCTMNVLESLILQLGGYGSVGTMMYPDDEDEEGDVDVDGENDEAQNPSGSEDFNGSKQLGSTRQEFATSDTLISLLPVMLSNLCHLLRYPEAEEWTSPVQFSRTEPQKILGASRLRIVRLLESLVLLGDPNVDSQLCGSDCLEMCLDLFWKFQWCSMLHQSVANLLVHVFEGANTRAELQSYFLVNCNLLGRLMSSFWEGAENVSDTVMEDSSDAPPPSSTEVELGSIAEDAAAQVSDDEEAAPGREGEVEEKEMENMDSQMESKDADHIPPQSFRLGYMGHVIIICQALVHACSNDIGDPSVGGTTSTDMNGELGDYVERQNESSNDAEDEEGGELQQALETGQAADSVITDETPANPLILAQLVETHSLRKHWEEFVQTTLAQETAIQSTPLGGFPGQGPGTDPLHSHRPGLAEDEDYEDEDGAAPPLPPRGLLVGGDVIDMDDNDLDVAASMMAGLSMGRSAEGSGRNDQDLLAGIPQQAGDGARNYMFDDPLGDGRFGRFDGDDDDDSSDEESELSGKSGDSGGAVVEGVSGSADHTADAPVMDLFAGNFDNAFDGANQEGENQQGGDWSDFANFDNAFEGSNGPPPPSESEDPFKEGPTDVNIENIFGDTKDHAELLEEDVDPATDAVAAKVGSSDDGSSSDEEDPAPEEAETPESS
jgi:hypothetical protein